MFSPQNKVFATVLLFGVMICWGAWVPLRMKSHTEAPVFVTLYVCSQWFTILFYSLTLGMITDVGNLFDGSTFLGALINAHGSYKHIIYLIIGGFFNANGDFLCAAACAKLPASVANPIYGGLTLIQGTLLNFFVESFEGNMAELIGGVFSALLGILSLTLSDHFAVSPDTRSSRFSVCSANESEDGDGGLAAAHLYQSLTEWHDTSATSHGSASSPLSKINKWIYACVLAGVVCGSWSPLAVLATEGKGHVENPYVLMFWFMTGQAAAVPFMIWYYSYFNMSTLVPDSKRPSINGLFNCIQHIVRHTSGEDSLYACLTGVVVGTGFFLYFTAADVIPSTISFAVSNCAPLVTIVIDVVFNGHLKHASSKQTGFMALASLLFSLGIALLVMANN
jgi:glucose uptake protein GlcU